MPYVHTPNTKKCLYCAEDIKIDALICHFCQRPQKSGNFIVRIALLTILFPLIGVWLYVFSDRIPFETQTLNPLIRCDRSEAVKAVKPYVIRVENKTDSGTYIGTGFIEKNGFIITNSHVVDIEGIITVFAKGEEPRNTVLISNDNRSDIAILKNPFKTLRALRWGQSDRLPELDVLIGVGYALDLPGEASATNGALSARRQYDGINYLQTQTPLSSGSSGGPLINSCGEVVGVSTLASNNAQLVNFAITSEDAQAIVEELIYFKRVNYTDPKDTGKQREISDPTKHM